MIPLAAYCDRLSVRPGETIRFHCANATGQDVSAELLRVVSADPNPAGPGIITEPVDARVRPLAHAEPQSVPHGSCLYTPGLPEALTRDSFSLYCRAQPTFKGVEDQVLLSVQDSRNERSVRLGIDACGHLYGEVSGAPRIRLNVVMRIGHWVQVWLSLSHEGQLGVGCAGIPGRALHRCLVG